MKVTEKQGKMLWAKAVKGQGMTKEQLAAFLGARYGVSKTEELEGGKENVDGYIHAIENWKSGQPISDQTPAQAPAPATPEKKFEPYTRKSDPQDRTSIERQKALAEAVNWASGQNKDPLEVIEVAKKFLDFIGSGSVPFSVPVEELLPIDDAPVPADKPATGGVVIIEETPKIREKDGRFFFRNNADGIYYSTFSGSLAEDLKRLEGQKIEMTFTEGEGLTSRRIVSFCIIRESSPETEVFSDKNAVGDDQIPF